MSPNVFSSNYKKIEKLYSLLSLGYEVIFQIFYKIISIVSSQL